MRTGKLEFRPLRSRRAVNLYHGNLSGSGEQMNPPLLGGWWYSPAGFGRAWLAGSKNSINELGSPAVPMTLTFFSTFFSAIVLSLIIIAVGEPTFLKGACLGLAVGIGLISTSMFSDSLFCGNSMQLFLIQAGFRIVLMVIMGAILGAWHG